LYQTNSWNILQLKILLQIVGSLLSLFGQLHSRRRSPTKYNDRCEAGIFAGREGQTCSNVTQLVRVLKCTRRSCPGQLGVPKSTTPSCP